MSDQAPDPTAERGAGVDEGDGHLDLDNLPNYWRQTTNASPSWSRCPTGSV